MMWWLEMWWGKDGEGAYYCDTRREAVELMRETRKELREDEADLPFGWRVVKLAARALYGIDIKEVQ